MTRIALAEAVAAFHARTPPRIWSLIVSFLGDAILPRGGVVQAAVISEFCGLAGVEPGLVRTALSRLVAKNIVAREREGRKSFYRLTPDERRAFETAAELIYARRLPEPTGDWDILLIDRSEGREGARAAALAAGYAPYGGGGLIRPAHAGRAAMAEPGALAFRATALDESPALGASLHPVAELAAGYRRFLARYAAFAAPAALEPGDATLARVLLVHDFRRIALRDPFLPAAALPADWPAADARRLMLAAHARLTPAAERWLTERC